MTDWNKPLSGFALFARQLATGAPAAITINLDRKPLAPDQLRTWLCRVSVHLLKPSKDGLAEDPAEIRALGDLSEAMLDAMQVVQVEFVAMATTAGVRSWIVYTSTGIGIDEIVKQAFARQRDYDPTVTVEADPSWSVYLSLYPTGEEERAIRVRKIADTEFARHRAMTPAVVKGLQDKGDDLRPRKIDFSFSFPNAESRDAFAEQVTSQTFVVEKKPGPREGDEAGYSLNISRIDSPTVERVLVIERYLITQATRRGGSYLGWGCFAHTSGTTVK